MPNLLEERAKILRELQKSPSTLAQLLTSLKFDELNLKKHLQTLTQLHMVNRTDGKYAIKEKSRRRVRKFLSVLES